MVVGRWLGAVVVAAAVSALGACAGGGRDFPGSGGGSSSGAGGASSSSGSGGGGASSGGSGGSSGSTPGFGDGGGGGLGSGTCQSGHYAGTFDCMYFAGTDAGMNDPPDAGGFGPVKGTLSFTLTQDVTSTGELTSTDTASGTFLADTGGFIAAKADLSGTLDCTTGKFVGQLLHGIYGLNFGGTPVANPSNTFEGPLVSDYDGKTSAFVNGRWLMTISTSQGECIGTWSASYAGPGDAGVVDAAGQ